MLNEFFLYVLEDLHTCQSLGVLQFTSDDPDFVKDMAERVYPVIPPTATAQEMPETMAFSRPLVAYIAAFLPIAPYFKANDCRISGVCDDQYTATLELLEETGDEAYKLYITRKTQGWFRRWGCSRTSDVAAAPVAAPGGAGASTPARVAAPVPSDDEDGSELITPARGSTDHNQAPSPSLTLLTLPSEPAPLAKGTRHPRRQDFSPLLAPAKLRSSPLPSSAESAPRLC